MVVGPEWKGETPQGIKKVFRSSTDFSLAIFRTQLLNSDDMSNVEKVQSGYRMQRLSAYLRHPAPPSAPVSNFPPINDQLVKKEFFEYLDFALKFAPSGPEEKEIRTKLARIGIGPGKTFDFNKLPLTHKLEIGLGMKDGEKKVVEKLKILGKDINGWRVGSPFGDRDFYHGD